MAAQGKSGPFPTDALYNLPAECRALEDPVKKPNEARIAATRRSVRRNGLGAALGCAVIAAGASGAAAAEVTYDRLVKPEPQNWLMNHHDFGSHRYSALDIINKTNARTPGRRRLHVHDRRLERRLQD
jgi:hypothetical protein